MGNSSHMTFLDFKLSIFSQRKFILSQIVPIQTRHIELLSDTFIGNKNQRMCNFTVFLARLAGIRINCDNTSYLSKNRDKIRTNYIFLSFLLSNDSWEVSNLYRYSGESETLHRNGTKLKKKTENSDLTVITSQLESSIRIINIHIDDSYWSETLDSPFLKIDRSREIVPKSIFSDCAKTKDPSYVESTDIDSTR